MQRDAIDEWYEDETGGEEWGESPSQASSAKVGGSPVIAFGLLCDSVHESYLVLARKC